MKAVDVKPMHLAVAVAAIVGAYVWIKGARGAAQSVTQAAGDAVGGLVEGLGLGLGLPTTDASKCAAAKAAGSAWGQSFYCPAPDFLSSVIGGASDVIGEGVQGAGSVLGIPRTNQSQCEIDKAAGDYLGASFHCPAGDFLAWGWDRITK